MENECEDQTMREKARRLAADAADDKMMTMMDSLLETFVTKLDALMMRMDAFAKRHGYT